MPPCFSGLRACACVCVCVCCVGRHSSVGLECCNGVKTSGTLSVVGSSLSDENFVVISLGKKLTHICLSRLSSINEYLALAGVENPLAVAYASGVQVGLRVLPTVGDTVGAPGPAPGDRQRWPRDPCLANRGPSH